MTTPLKVRILLADDHAIVRQGFRMILEEEPDFEVVGDAANGGEAIAMAGALHPDLVVMDVSMRPMNGIEATRRICADFPGVRVLALSMHRDAVYVREIFRAGARGYLLKDAPEGDFVRAVRAVARGQKWLSGSLPEQIFNGRDKQVDDPIELLTARELEVLQLVGEGKSNKEIATAMTLSVYTVEAHRSRIMEKLGLANLGEMVRFAMRKGVVS